MLVDILGTTWDQCQSMVQYSFTSTKTRRLVGTDSPGRPPRLSHSSWTMCVALSTAQSYIAGCPVYCPVLAGCPVYFSVLSGCRVCCPVPDPCQSHLGLLQFSSSWYYYVLRKAHMCSSVFPMLPLKQFLCCLIHWLTRALTHPLRKIVKHFLFLHLSWRSVVHLLQLVPKVPQGIQENGRKFGKKHHANAFK